MSISSEDSLSELPLPYDISSAVSRALRINSASDGTPLRQPHGRSMSVCPSYYLTANDDSRDASKEVRRASHPHNYYDCQYQSYNHSSQLHAINFEPKLNYPFPSHPDRSTFTIQTDMEPINEITAVTLCSSTEDFLESEANANQLDQFCKYIDCTNDNDPITTNIPEYGPVPPLYDTVHRRYTITGESVPLSLRMREPMRKKIRSYTAYMDDCSSPEVSPMKQYPPPASCYTLGCQQWTAQLENSHLWKQFDQIGTEMVITKGGRRMFPSMVVSLSGLDPHAIYTLKLEILPTDGKRYKFLQTEWVTVGKADKKQVYRDYVHPDSPNNGAFWMEKEINFKLVKLTNNKGTKHPDQVILNSMQKYQPQLQLTCETTGATQYFSFEESKFIAVTAYQNSQITQLKINNNPYARAFRENMLVDGNLCEKKGGHYRERSSSPVDGAREHSISPQNSPSSSPQKRHHNSHSEATTANSAISIESGFESEDSTEQMHPHYTLHTDVDSTMLFPTKILTQPNPFSSSSLTYWVDDNSLWNPNLITPDPLMDSTSSFSEPYLRESSVMSSADVSPIKGFYPVENTYDGTHVVDIDTADDDVFF